MKLLDRMTRSMAARRSPVVLRADFAAMGSVSQISRVLAELTRRGQLVRIGTGIYAKTRVSSVTGNKVPAGSLESLAAETLTRMGISISPGRAAREYNAGLTTQLPGRLVFDTKRRRIRRRITVGDRTLEYENEYRG